LNRSIKNRKEDSPTNIAIVTVSARAYYKLTSEFKKRAVPFFSLTDLRNIPPNIKVVISTEQTEKTDEVPFQLTYNEQDDPTDIVVKAIQIAQGKPKYDQLFVGVDPGKRIGIAVVSNSGVLFSTTSISVDKAVSTIIELLNNIQADKKSVKVGDGGGIFCKKIVDTLNDKLPLNVSLEIVNESGTSSGNGWKIKRSMIDIASAATISTRNGKVVRREKIPC
jgi:hypothetical protein